jgi:RNA polymerase sigma-70 factor (ECF subfamily)
LTGAHDEVLVAKSLQGNQKAFRELISRHHATAFAVVRSVMGDRDDVEDVVQQVYIRVHRGLASFRGDARFSTWLYRIARNEAINAVKRPDRVQERAALGEHLERAMQHLDENQRTALELRYMGERTYEEIAEIMDVPLGTVKTYIHRGKAELKRILSRTGDGVAERRSR